MTSQGRRHWPVATLAFTVLVLCIHVLGYASYALTAIRYPYELDYGEGIVWQQAMLIPGPRMYGDITQYPFLVFHYPPVYHLAVRAVAACGVDPLLAGRAISAGATVAIAFLIAGLTFRATRVAYGRLPSLAGATIAGLTLFCYRPVVTWSVLMRVDMLAIALSFAGIWCAARAGGRPWLLYAGMVLFVLAVFTKQTCVSAPLAAMAVVLLVNPRLAIKVTAFGLALGCAAVAILTVVTHGGFLRHVVVYNLNRFDVTLLLGAFEGQAWQFIFVLLAIGGVYTMAERLAAEGVFDSIEELRRHLSQRDDVRLTATIAIYAALASATLITRGKQGAAMNYFIEWMATLSMLIGVLVAATIRAGIDPSAVAGTPSRSRALGGFLKVFALLLIQIEIMPMHGDETAISAERTRDSQTLVEMIRDASRPVLSDDMVLLMRAGQEVPWEPAIFTELASTGRWEERKIIDMITAHSFAFLITHGDSERDPLFHERYTPDVRSAMHAAYPLTNPFDKRIVHFPAEPSVRATKPTG